MKRLVCLITGSRADFGLVQWLARGVAEDERLALRLLVTGSHLDSRFGLTWREIEAGGFTIDDRVSILDGEDSALGIANAVSRGITGMTEALARSRPDIVVILGDRFEMLAAATAALILRIPVAHLHGGETTEGAIDEAIRHSITKMAHLHFTAAEAYRRRVIQMGESPGRVFMVGAPGLDSIVHLPLLAKPALEQLLGFELGDQFFLVTYHPATLNADDPGRGMAELLAALESFPEHKILITGTNADLGYSRIGQALRAYMDAHPGRAVSVASLGQQRYLSALRLADCMIGNSSSGLVEAPAMKVPTVNVGTRQKGRLRAASVLDCEERRDAIRDAVVKALSPAFRRPAFAEDPPYGGPGASARIKDILATFPLEGITMKSFHDLSCVP